MSTAAPSAAPSAFGTAVGDAGVDLDRAIAGAIRAFREPVSLHDLPGLGRVPLSDGAADLGPPVGRLPGIWPEWLGGPAGTEVFGCRFPYVVGEMAQGIATARMTVAAVRHGFTGFFGSAGLPLETTRAALAEIRAAVGPDAAWGANLIHTPDDPAGERALADLLVEQDVRLVSASAFMALSPEVVRLSAGGLVEGPAGPRRARRVVAKVSRTEVARAFMAPPPETMLRDLVAAGRLDERQANWASRLPVAAAVTAEADSGGHTDNRQLVALLPALAALRASVATAPVALGAAGGLGTPEAVAAAFALGADYVLTGSVNQSAVESGLSAHARTLLAAAGPADVAMAPAADMFERGVQVQVLARGTLFAPTARRLHEIYRRRAGFDALDEREREFVERRVLREPFESAWEQTRSWLLTANPALAAKGDRDPRQRLASVFRRYLFDAAGWARAGRVDRQGDYQIWCGPAMGAFNAWVEGSWLAAPQAREVGQIGLNLLEGAAQLTRAQQLRALGVAVGPQHFVVRPRRLALDGGER